MSIDEIVKEKIDQELNRRLPGIKEQVKEELRREAAAQKLTPTQQNDAEFISTGKLANKWGVHRKTVQNWVKNNLPNLTPDIDIKMTNGGHYRLRSSLKM